MKIGIVVNDIDTEKADKYDELRHGAGEGDGPRGLG